MVLNYQSKSHKRICKFVEWIAPDPNTRDTIKEQRPGIRNRIKNKAKEDGLTVASTPNAGSFEKKTGLRRHCRGNSEIEGQDVDLPFVVEPETEEGEELNELLKGVCN